MKLQVGLEWNMNNSARESLGGLPADRWECEIAYRLLLGLGTVMFEKYKNSPQFVEAWGEIDHGELERKYGYMSEKQWKLTGSPVVEFVEIWSDEERAGARLTIGEINDYEKLEYGLGGSWLSTFHAGTFPDSVEMKMLSE